MYSTNSGGHEGRCSSGYGEGSCSSSIGYASAGISTIYGSSISGTGSPSSMYSTGPMQSSSYGGPAYNFGEAKATTAESYNHASPLEIALENIKPLKSAASYMTGKDRLHLYLTNKKYISATAFLSPDRPNTPVVQEESEIMPYVKETFEKLTGKPFPEDKLKLHVLDDKAFEKAHGKEKFGPGIMGFALNRQGRGTDEVFVRKTHLDHMMLTIGHEIGHVMSPTLPDNRDEEAKAFAFSVAWMETIKKHNIAGIGNAVLPNPARNGLHDVAYEYLLELIEKGNGALHLFRELASGATSITRRLEVIYQ